MLEGYNRGRRSMGDTPANRGDQVNILVVDDNAENRLSLSTILSEPGQNVVTAASGRDALRRLLEQEFAVILLDVKMPVMDGFETAALVRQRKSSERTPIIFITAFSDETHVSRGYLLGAVDYIVSPVVPEVLRSKVAVFVDLFRKTEQIRHQATSLRRRADQLYHLTEASLAINSADSLDEILEIVTETARDLLAPRCALTVTNLEQAHRAARPGAFFGGDPDELGDCDQQLFMAQAAAVTAALGDQQRAVLLTAGEVATDPRWEVLRDAPGDAPAAATGGGSGSAPAAAGRAGESGEPGAGAAAAAAGAAAADSLGADRGKGRRTTRKAAGKVARGTAAPARRGCGAASSGWLAAPLTGRDGRSFGWVHLCGRARVESGEFADEDRTILTQLAQVASIAIENTLSSEAREANRLKDEFLTTLSHELRTPLTAILGWTRVLRTSPLEAERFQHGLEVIERNVTAQAKLIEDLLDVSRIIADKLRVSLRPIPLLPAIEAAVEAMRPAAEAKGVALRLLIGPEVDPREAIAGDADRLQQVGLNLISNAVKFTPPGGHVEVAVSRQPEGFKVRVTDTGKGISAQFLRHVFDRFRQDDSSSTRAHRGLGIGLAIVQHIVELHGGKVAAESPGLNRGATFTVTLPLLPAAVDAGIEDRAAPALAAPVELAALPALPALAADTAALPTPTIAEAMAGAELGQLRLLVVDDEPDTLEILSEILRAAGAKVATAASLAEALALVETLQPDLLISDIAMPGGDGYALIRQLRRRSPERGGRVPAIAVSAHARGEDRRRALAAGFERYVTKPVEPGDLIAVVRDVAARGRAATEAAEAAKAAAAAAVAAAAAEEHARAAELAVGAAPAVDGAVADGRGQAADRAQGAAEPAMAPFAHGGNGGRLALDGGACRILLVEDDADTREALKTLLELNGHQVEVAADGGEAVAHVIAHRPDVALVDIGLPEIDGNEVARRIRAQLGAGGIFLVALTGYGGEADEELARAAGFDAHFTKPVEVARLNRLLRATNRAGQ